MKNGNFPVIKLVLLGEKNVGKTCLFDRLITGGISETTQTTIGLAFGVKQFEVDDQTQSISIIDTAGAEKFDSLTTFYTRGANCAFICCDLTDRTSFLKAKKQAMLLEESCVVMILGNKCDLINDGTEEREISVDDIADFSERIGALYCEGSALTGYGIETAFHNVVAQYISQSGSLILDNDQDSIKLPFEMEDNAVFSRRRLRRVCCFE